MRKKHGFHQTSAGELRVEPRFLHVYWLSHHFSWSYSNFLLLNSPQRCSKLKSTAFIDENHNFPSRIDVKTGNLSHPKLFEPLKKIPSFRQRISRRSFDAHLGRHAGHGRLWAVATGAMETTHGAGELRWRWPEVIDVIEMGTPKHPQTTYSWFNRMFYRC